MSIDRDTIEKISELYAAAANVPKTDVPTAVLPNGVNIHNLEQFMERPSRFRGHFATKNLSAYERYLNMHPNGQCFIDGEDFDALCYFDLGDPGEPGHGEHTARLTLAKTTEMKQVEAMNEELFAQRDLAELIQDWSYTISVEDSDGEHLPLARALASIRNVSIESITKGETEVRDFGESKSLMEKVEAEAKDKLPALIHFTAAPRHHLGEYVFTFRVSIITARGYDTPKFRLRCVNMQQQLDVAAEEFENLIHEFNIDGIDVIPGYFAKK